MTLTIENFFKRLWTLLWDKELPVLLQIIGFGLTILITHQLDSATSDHDRTMDAFVAEVHSFETDGTSVNVQFGAFADTIIRPELAPENERVAMRAASVHERDVARESLMDSLVRTSSDADNLAAASDPHLRPLIHLYQDKASALLETIRTTDDFDSLKPAYHALGDFLGAQGTLMEELRKKSGLVS